MQYRDGVAPRPFASVHSMVTISLTPFFLAIVGAMQVPNCCTVLGATRMDIRLPIRGLDMADAVVILTHCILRCVCYGRVQQGVCFCGDARGARMADGLFEFWHVKAAAVGSSARSVKHPWPVKAVPP